MDIEKLKAVLTKSRDYAAKINAEAETRHDQDFELSDFEDMQESEQLIKDIDLLFAEINDA